MKRKQETFLDLVIKNYTNKNITELMIEDFKQSLIPIDKVNFIDKVPAEGEYRNFTNPDKNGTMYCQLRVYRQDPMPHQETMYTLATVKAIPEQHYCFTEMRVGLIHCASIAETPYVIIYEIYGGY